VPENKKEIYKRLCDNTPEIPLFLQYNWVNTLYEKWDIALYYKADDCFAFMIFPITRKKGFTLIHIPVLSPFQGFFIQYPKEQKKHKKHSFEHKILHYFIEHIPANDWLRQKLPYGFTNFLPFYWQNFTIHPKITYELDLSLSTDALFNELKESLRRNIKKSEQLQHTIIRSNDTGELFRLKQMHQESEPVKYSAEYLQNIITASNGNYFLLYAQDVSGKIIASVFIVFDKQTAYYLTGSVDNQFKNTGVLTRLLWEGINLSKKQGCRFFNLEGSMIPSIERYFSNFGAYQKIYFEIEKINNPLLKLKNKIL